MNNIGWCGYHTWYIDHRRAEIGYAIRSDEYKAQGIMTEVMNAVLRYGFEVMNLHRIEAFIGRITCRPSSWSRNSASQKRDRCGSITAAMVYLKIRWCMRCFRRSGGEILCFDDNAVGI